MSEKNEQFIVLTHYDGLDWNRTRVANSRREAVAFIEESRNGRPLSTALRQKISAFIDGRPESEWCTRNTGLVYLRCDSFDQTACDNFDDKGQVYGVIYKVTR